MIFEGERQNNCKFVQKLSFCALIDDFSVNVTTTLFSIFSLWNETGHKDGIHASFYTFRLYSFGVTPYLFLKDLM